LVKSSSSWARRGPGRIGPTKGDKKKKRIIKESFRMVVPAWGMGFRSPFAKKRQKGGFVDLGQGGRGSFKGRLLCESSITPLNAYHKRRGRYKVTPSPGGAIKPKDY
jgi:hypothetical protein